MKYPVVIFGVKDVTATFAAFINQFVCHVDLIVTIDDEIPKGAIVSGYGSMDAVQEEFGTALFKTDAYNLKSDAARAFFEQNEFGIGISMNWSRLIPGWILDRFEAGVFGLHGSSGYLPFGQGRATLNWSLIHGDGRFIMHMFKLDAGVDAPNIFDRVMFEINEFDDIRTLQFKDLLASEKLAANLLKNYKAGLRLQTHLQSSDPQSTYPGRKPEDGRIDILARTREICNLVRAVTHPFPGAFAFCGENRVTVWRAQAFDRMLDFSACRPGEVITMLDGNPLIRTVDGTLIIMEYEADVPLHQGDLLS